MSSRGGRVREMKRKVNGKEWNIETNDEKRMRNRKKSKDCRWMDMETSQRSSEEHGKVRDIGNEEIMLDTRIAAEKRHIRKQFYFYISSQFYF